MADLNGFDVSRKVVEIVHTYLQEGNDPASQLILDLGKRDLRYVLGDAIGMLARVITDHHGPLPYDWDIWHDTMMDQIATAETSAITDG